MNLSLLKKKNILGMPPSYQQNPPTTDQPTDDDVEEQDEPQDEDDEPTVQNPTVQNPTTSRFSELYKAASEKPVGPANQNLQNFLSKGAPQKEDIPISKTRRLSAILGGAAEGFQGGANRGIKTAQDVLNMPYEQKMNEYAIQSKNLEKAAEIEDKGYGRAASFAKTAAADERTAQTAATAKDALDKKAAHWDRQDTIAATNAGKKGITHVMGADGHSYFQVPNGDGTITTLDGGKIGESIPEKTRRTIDTFSQTNAIRVKGQKDVGDNTEANREIGENKRLAGQAELNKETQDRIDARANRGKKTQVQVTGPDGKVTGNRSTITRPEDETVTMIDKNGKEGPVKKADVEEAKKAGYRIK